MKECSQSSQLQEPCISFFLCALLLWLITILAGGHNWQTLGYDQLQFPHYTSQVPYQYHITVNIININVNINKVFKQTAFTPRLFYLAYIIKFVLTIKRLWYKSELCYLVLTSNIEVQDQALLRRID